MTVVDIDRPPAGFAGPALPLRSHKRTDTVRSDCRKVVDNAHKVFLPVPLVQLREAPAREPCTGKTVPALPFRAGEDEAVRMVFYVRAPGTPGTGSSPGASPCRWCSPGSRVQ